MVCLVLSAGYLAGAERRKKSGFDSGTSELEIIDLGCGDGTLTVEMAKFAKHVTGVDINPDILAMAQAAYGQAWLAKCKFLVEDVSKLSLSSESLDVVFFSQSLHHLENPQKGLHEAARILRPGGQGFSYGTCLSPRRMGAGKTWHKWLGFEKEYLIDCMQNAGLKNLYSEVLPHRREELFQIIICAGSKS